MREEKLKVDNQNLDLTGNFESSLAKCTLLENELKYVENKIAEKENEIA